MTEERDKKFPVGERLDKALASLYPEYSRSALEKLIESGKITVNGDLVKTKYILRTGDDIDADFQELTKAVEIIELPILYEDENVIVINKPAGVLTHSKGNFNKEGTVASFIQPRLNGSVEWKLSNRAGIVHRLDRATSGVIICAKNEAAQTHLQKQFAKRNVKKAYRAVIQGMLNEKTGLIDVPIERNPKKPATFRAGANGKTAQTEFEVLKTNQNYSLIELRPHTGRTHQLRVHMKYLGHLIVGDELYGGEQNDRLLLHAYKLEVTLLSSERKTFEAPMPEEFNKPLQ